MNNTFPDKGKFKEFFFFLVRRASLKVQHKKTLRQRRHDARRKTGRLGVKGKNREDKCLDDYQRCFCYVLLKTVFNGKSHCLLGFSVCEDVTNFHIPLERVKDRTKVCIHACRCVYSLIYVYICIVIFRVMINQPPYKQLQQKSMGTVECTRKKCSESSSENTQGEREKQKSRRN